MNLRKRCSANCFAAAILIILGINILVYCLVDRGFLSNFSYIEAEKVIERNVQIQQPTKKSIERKEKPKPKGGSEPKFVPTREKWASSAAANKIWGLFTFIATRDQNISKSYEIFTSVINDFMIKPNVTADFRLLDKWISGLQILPQSVPELGSLLQKLCTSKILKADNTRKGTQLKLLLTLEGGYKALFKPQWYLRSGIIDGPVYAGKDRHNAEVAAFHLSLILGLRRVPLTVGRRIDLRREIMPVASPALRETFFQEGNNTCFYGVCYYCSPSDPVCARRDTMEGALILWLPNKLSFARFSHPWQRSYRRNMIARWEVEDNYCNQVKSTTGISEEILLDLIDTAIFDFLIDNGDRHHFEAPTNTKPYSIFLFDNGKSFGNPNNDHIDILAPLYQCCVIRRKTWDNLLKFRGGNLGEILDKTLKNSHIYPVLTKEHLAAIDRRIILVYAAVEICLNDNQPRSVLL